MSSDERLVRRASQGDPRAFEAIYRRYHQQLYRFCLAMVGNPQDAQDALQNTMVKVLRALPGEEREIQLKPWLYRIARNESVETLRKRRDDDELKPQQVAVAGPAETAEARARLRTLLADIDQLPERQRAALVMRELSGLAFDEIADAFETSPAVARQTLYEARLSLRQLAKGREMRCSEVMREISDADGRITRGREIQAHLRSCAECRAFREDIAGRRQDLAALAPLPVAASAGLLHSLLGAKLGAASGGVGGPLVAGAGKTVATSAVLKSVATVAVVATVGVSADRSGLVDLPLPGRNDSKPAQRALEPAGIDIATGARSTVGGQPETADGVRRPVGARESKGDQGGNAPVAPDTAGRSADGHAGLNPPGGGYGSSSAERHGRPEQLPAAASHGQQTAAGHKPSHAATPLADGDPSTPGQGKPAGGGAAKPAPPPEPAAQASPPSPSGPPVDPPGSAKEGPAAGPDGARSDTGS